MNRRIVWSRPAQREMGRLAPDVAERILTAIERLALTGLGNVRPLAGQARLRRLRVGSWRLVSADDEETGVIHVVRVQPRDRAYRG